MADIVRVPRKRRSKMVCDGPATEVDEAHKKVKVVPQSEEADEQCEITQEEYHQSLKAKWTKLSQKIIVYLGPKEMAALCHELEVVGSSEELSSVMHSNGTNTTATAAAEIASLQAQVEQLQARNAEHEERTQEISETAYIDAQTAKTTELEVECAMQKAIALKETLERNIAHLEEENAKQSLIIEFYGTRIEDLKTRTGELEDRLAAAPSKGPRTDDCGKEIRDENSLEELLTQNTRLKEELARLRSQLDVTVFQVELEIGKKEGAIAELMALQDQKAVFESTKAELIKMHKQKQLSEAEKTELRELRFLKRISQAERYELEEFRCLKGVSEAERDELEELRRLKGISEAERDELAALRGQKKTFESAQNEIKAVYERLPYQRTLLQAAAEELQALRSQKETFQGAIEELSGLRALKATYEAVSGDIATLQKQRASFETAAEELASLRKQKTDFDTVAKELEELRKHKEMSIADREELDLLRSQRAIFEPANGEFAAFRGRESAKTAKEQSLMEKVERLVLKQMKLVSTIKYLEAKRTQDKQEYDQCYLELTAARAKIHQASVDLEAALQQLTSVTKENEILHKEKTSVLVEMEALHGEKNRLLRGKQNLESRLRHANEQNLNLQLEIERVENAKTTLEVDSTVLNREAFLKEAKIECLKAELRWKEDEAGGTNMAELFEEVDTLREANRFYVDQERKLREELIRVTKQLEDAASEDLCRICHENTRDTVLLPCTHRQSCVRCVKELIHRSKPCPTCSRAISGFVPYNRGG